MGGVLSLFLVDDGMEWNENRRERESLMVVGVVEGMLCQLCQLLCVCVVCVCALSWLALPRALSPSSALQLCSLPLRIISPPTQRTLRGAGDREALYLG
jgi:hypothetical protein